MYYCPKAGFYDETQALSDAKTYADYPQAWKKDTHVEEKVCHLSLFTYLFDNLKFLGILESSSPGRTK